MIETTCNGYTNTDTHLCGNTATKVMFDCCNNVAGLPICDSCDIWDNIATEYCDVWFDSLVGAN
jgi:hypothetical protein